MNRSRASVPRSKRGCISCRQRRVKCDEERPICRRCIRAEIQCAGYDSVKDPCSTDITGSANTHPMQSLRVQSYNIPFYAPGRPFERKALHYFFSYASRDMAGLTVMGFWDKLLPCMAERESVVRHAIIALSLAHYDFAVLERPMVKGKVSAEPNEDILLAYLKASKALRRYIERGRSASKIVVLACCAVFYSIEGLLSQPQNALCHLEQGCAIIRGWQRQCIGRTSTGGTDIEFAENIGEIFPILARLDISATIMRAGRCPELDVLEAVDDEPIVPSLAAVSFPFHGALHAHNVLLQHSARLWRFLAQSAQYRDVDIGNVPEHILAERNRLRLANNQWDERMAAYEQAHPDMALDRTATESMQVLKARNIVNGNILAESFSDRSCGDIWSSKENQLLQLGEDILKLREAERRSHGFETYGSFSPEFGMVGVICLLAHRTSSPLIRRRAVEQAMRHDRHEGISDMCEKFLTWVQLPAPRPYLVLFYNGPGH